MYISPLIIRTALTAAKRVGLHYIAILSRHNMDGLRDAR